MSLSPLRLRSICRARLSMLLLLALQRKARVPKFPTLKFTVKAASAEHSHAFMLMFGCFCKLMVP